MFCDIDSALKMDKIRTEEIEAIGVDDKGSLWVKPAACSFPFIYRAAMGVQWDDGRRCLYAPKPQEGSYVSWFRQIVDAARREYGTELRIIPGTSWSNVETSVQQEILASIDGG